MCDMEDPEIFQAKLSAQIDRKNDIITKVYGGEPLNKEEIITKFLEYAEILRPRIKDTIVLVNGSDRFRQEGTF